MNKELTRLVSAMVLGDGCLYKRAKNAHYAFSQIAEHKDYGVHVYLHPSFEYKTISERKLATESVANDMI